MSKIVYIFLICVLSESSCLIENCETCSLLSNEVCINCNYPYIRDRLIGCAEDPARENIIENCVKDINGVCEICSEGYEAFEGRCNPECLPGCSCFEPYECLKSHSRVLCDIPNCFTCIYGTCYVCNSGYRLSKNSCVFDSTCSVNNCQTCSSINVCSYCETGYGLDIFGGCQSCPCNCYDCIGSTCSICNDGYNLENGKCVYDSTCNVLNCFTCDSPYVCSLCDYGYGTDGNGGCLSCPSGCSDCLEELCYLCENVYHLTRLQVCEPGSCDDHNCLKCDQIEYCDECYRGFKSDNYGGCQSCPYGCEVCTSYSCSSCFYGYHFEGSDCVIDSNSGGNGGYDNGDCVNSKCDGSYGGESYSEIYLLSGFSLILDLII